MNADRTCLAPAQSTLDALAQMRKSLLTPGATIDLGALAQSPQFQAARADEQRRMAVDWANLCRYEASNRALSGGPHPDVVFIGDSITDNWSSADPAFFNGKRIVGRGIGGQTSPQLLVRFYADVIALHPKAVHIMMGTNDIAGNTGPTTDTAIENNFRAMLAMAQANGIKVIIGSIPPARAFPWSPQLNPAPRIARINAFLRDLARTHDATYVDYHLAVGDGRGGMKAGLANDGVHPNLKGYAAMRPAAASAIAAVLRH